MITILIVFGCVYVFIGALFGIGLVMENLKEGLMDYDINENKNDRRIINSIVLIALVIVIWPYMLWEVLMK